MVGNQINLLQSNWKTILPHIKACGENDVKEYSKLLKDSSFWINLGVFKLGNFEVLTEKGKNIFESLFIRKDGLEKETIKHLVLLYPPTIALQQYLFGVKNVTVDQALSVLKMTEYWIYKSNEPMTHFLEFLNYAEVIKYVKKNRTIEILISPDTQYVPTNVFIDPSRPFSNIMWIKRILSECKKSILWLDKHFQKEAFEWLWAIADAKKINEIKILSLDLGESNLSGDAKKYYRRFKQEMANKGIEVIWATIDSKMIRDAHDRWIIDGTSYLRNIPNVNAITSGQRSEMNLSDNYREASQSFNDYWLKSHIIEF